MSFEDAVKLLMVSFDSTIKAKLSVNLPLDLHVYTADSLKHGTMTWIEKDDPYLNVISIGWRDALEHAFNSLPPIALRLSRIKSVNPLKALRQQMRRVARYHA